MRRVTALTGISAGTQTKGRSARIWWIGRLGMICLLMLIVERHGKPSFNRANLNALAEDRKVAPKPLFYLIFLSVR
jgi:hypothetical protein